MENSAIQLVVGKKYVSRDAYIYQIRRIITQTDTGYDLGYRFVGETDLLGDDPSFQKKYVVMFKPDGKHIIDGISSPSDLVKLHVPQIKEGELFRGCDVGEIKDQQIVEGAFTDWNIDSVWEISDGVFREAHSQALAVKVEALVKARPGAMYLIGQTIDMSGNVSSALTLYHDGTKHYCASIFYPGWFPPRNK